MKKSIKAASKSIQVKLKSLESDADKLDKLSKTLVKKITGHDAPLIKFTNIESQYMAAIKKSNGLVNGKPSTVQALKKAEKDASKAKVAAAITAMEKDVKEAKGQNKDDKAFKAYAVEANKVISSLKKLKIS